MPAERNNIITVNGNSRRINAGCSVIKGDVIMSKKVNTNYMERKSIGTKIVDYFSKYNREIMCGAVSVNGALNDEVLYNMLRK